MLDPLKINMHGKNITILLDLLKRNMDLHEEKNNYYIRPQKRKQVIACNKHISFPLEKHIYPNARNNN